MRLRAIVLSAVFIIGCANRDPNLEKKIDFMSKPLFENEFINNDRDFATSLFGRPSRVEKYNIKQINLVGQNKILIPIESELIAAGGDLVIIEYIYKDWRLYLYELQNGKIVASIRYNHIKIYL